MTTHELSPSLSLTVFVFCFFCPKQKKIRCNATGGLYHQDVLKVPGNMALDCTLGVACALDSSRAPV